MNNNKDFIAPELDEMIQVFAKNPRKAFANGGPDFDVLPWDPLTQQQNAFTFSRFAFAVATRDYGFHFTNDSAFYSDGFGDRGLDGIVISNNNQIIENLDQAKLSLDSSDTHDLRVLFLQSKMSKYIRANDVVVFGNSVQEFLTAPDFLDGIKTNDTVTEQWEVYRYFQQHLGYDFSPDVVLVFAYYGNWMNLGFPNVRQSRRTQIYNLRSAMPNARIALEIMDNEEMIKAGLMAGISVLRKIENVSVMALPEETSAKGYLGIVPAKNLIEAFSKIKINEQTDTLDDWLFMENPRYYRGGTKKENVGASALAESLQNGQQSQVLLCHNGVNIVVRDAELDGGNKTLTLITPQVINGCQSCYTMSNFRDKLDNVNIVLKITVTEDQSLKDAIVRGANTQEAVDDFDMLSRNSYVRDLEKEFERAAPDKRLWLERRWNERKLWEEEDPSFTIPDAKILTPKQLMNGFVSCILGQPHSVHQSSVHALSKLDLNGKSDKIRVFMKEQEPTIYRAIGWTLVASRLWGYKVNKAWLDAPHDPVNRGYWARYHYLYALWRITDQQPGQVERKHLLRGPIAQKRFERIIDKLSTPEVRDQLTSLAEQIIELADKKADLMSDKLPRRYRTVRAGFKQLIESEIENMQVSE